MTPIELARQRGVQVPRRHEGQQGQHHHDRQRRPAPERQGIEIHGDDVPERGEAQEIAVVGLGLDLAEAVDAGQQRKQEPGLVPRREDLRTIDQQQGEERVGQEVDDVIQTAAVEAGHRLLDPDLARQGAVGRVDERRHQHQQE